MSCPFHYHGKHVYKYRGDEFKCPCGKTVEYDIVKRDFREKQK